MAASKRPHSISFTFSASMTIAVIAGCGTSSSVLPVADVVLQIPDQRSRQARDAVRVFAAARGFGFIEDVRPSDPEPRTVLLEGRKTLKLTFTVDVGANVLRATVYCYDQSADWRGEVERLRRHLEGSFPGLTSIEKERPDFCKTPNEHSWSLWKG
jgi:hypothetical protein